MYNIISLNIIGEKKYAVELLANYLNEKAGFLCRIITVSEIRILSERSFHEPELILCDYSTYEKISRVHDFDTITKQDNYTVVLFDLHASHGVDVEIKVYKNGIRGAFYEDVSISILMKGIDALCRGDLWFSRKALSAIADKKQIYQPQIESNYSLTDREKDILILISFGLSNKEIAERLYISQHTVKTHIYNVYKKIDVDNRQQALLWANQHLSANPAFNKRMRD